MFKHKLAVLLFLACLLCVPASAPATIAFVNSTTGNADGFATSIAAAAANHTAGNLLVVGVEFDSGTLGGVLSNLSDTALNTYTVIPGSKVTVGTTNLQIAYAKNIKGNPANVVTATFTAAAQFRRIIVHQYSGADTTDPFDVAAVGSNATGSTALSTSAVTTNFANEVLVVFGSNNDGVTTTFTPGTNFTIRVPQIANDMGSEDRIVSATGSYSGTMTTGGSFTWRCSMAAFKEATQPAGPPGRRLPTSKRAASDVLAGLCQLIGCECSDPVITSVEYPEYPEPVQTGLPVGVKGCGFGNNPDSHVFQVWLTLQDYKQPSNEVDVPLYPVQLRDDTVVAIVPGRTTPSLPGYDYTQLPNPPDPNFRRPDFNLPRGVRDQTACLQVFRKITRMTRGGPVEDWYANPCFSVKFQALRYAERLPGTDVQYLPNESVADIPVDIYGIAACYQNASRDFSTECDYPICDQIFCRTASGTDVYQIGPLINDWVFTQFTFDKSVVTGELEVRDPSPPYPVGATSWKPAISWWVDSNDKMWYTGKLYIEGPCGVPWRLGGPDNRPCD
jgi:hypothetical protein